MYFLFIRKHFVMSVIILNYTGIKVYEAPVTTKETPQRPGGHYKINRPQSTKEHNNGIIVVLIEIWMNATATVHTCIMMNIKWKHILIIININCLNWRRPLQQDHTVVKIAL